MDLFLVQGSQFHSVAVTDTVTKSNPEEEWAYFSFRLTAHRRGKSGQEVEVQAVEGCCWLLLLTHPYLTFL